MKYSALLSITLVILFSACTPKQENKALKPIRFDIPESSILKGVKLPGGSDIYISSGIVALPKDESKPVGHPEYYGNTHEQSISTLKRIEGYLREEGLSLKDVVSMKVFIAPDPMKENKPDFDAWFEAYGLFFNNENNPNKVARTTLGVHSLAREGLLIEIEVVAAY